MSDETSMSVGTAAQTALENPDDASAAIQTLFDYVEEGGDEVRDAAVSLSLVAGRAPEAIDGLTDRFESALKTADGSYARLNLAEAVNELLEHQAIPPQDAGPALTEATRVRDDEYWEDQPDDELQNIRKGLNGWTDVAAMGEPVPEIVVRRAMGISEIADHSTLLRILDLLQAAVASGSSMREKAFQGIAMLAKEGDETLTSESTIAVAELVLSGEIPDEDIARNVITTNAKTVQRENQLVEQALEEISA